MAEVSKFSQQTVDNLWITWAFPSGSVEKTVNLSIEQTLKEALTAMIEGVTASE